MGCCCCGSDGWRPLVCLPELSRNAQMFLRLQFNAGTNALEDETGAPAGQLTKLSQMAQLSVDGCIKLNPCCTSQLTFSRTQDLIDFLAVPDGSLSAEQLRIKRFLMGRYSCP